MTSPLMFISDHTIIPPSVNTRIIGVLSTLAKTAAPHSEALCVQLVHDRSNCSTESHTCDNCVGSHNALYRGCLTYKFESEVAILRVKLGLTLRKAKQEARRLGFSLTPYSNTDFCSSPPPPSQDVSAFPPIIPFSSHFYPLPPPFKFFYRSKSGRPNRHHYSKHYNLYLLLFLLAQLIAQDKPNVSSHFLLHLSLPLKRLSSLLPIIRKLLFLRPTEPTPLRKLKDIQN